MVEKERVKWVWVWPLVVTGMRAFCCLSFLLWKIFCMQLFDQKIRMLLCLVFSYTWFAGLFGLGMTEVGRAEENVPVWRAVESDQAIEVRYGEALVLRYAKQPPTEAANHPPALARSGFIHPLLTPSGRVVTDDLSENHPHQHGLFFAWTKTAYEGQEVEFWNEMLGKGKIRYVKTITLVNEKDHAGFVVLHAFDDLTGPAGPRTVLFETWRLVVRQRENRYELNLESRQRCATDRPLQIKQYHYGGMAFRGSSQWLQGSGQLMRTSQGLGRQAGNHTRPDWVEISGLIDGAECGVRIRPDSRNFRHPQWVRLHPSLPYFVFSPMVEEPFEIRPGTEYVSRFQIDVFDGKLE